MAKAVAEVADKNALPDFLQGGKQSKFGNTDTSDLILPRIKLIQAVSPEAQEFDAAKPGNFWHNIAQESLGNTIRGIPILLRKHYVLWAPRKGDDRGILARATDGIHWDTPNVEFTVKPEKSQHPVTYKLGTRVDERVGGQKAVSEFGSSIPGDDKSPPAASLTYDFLWYLIDFPELSPSIIINTRSSVKVGGQLITRIESRPVDSYAQIYNIGVKKDGTPQEPYFNYTYTADGYVQDKALFEITKQLYDNFSTTMWRANDEGNEGGEGGGSRSSGHAGPADSEKF